MFMKTYHLESTIQQDGVIVLPKDVAFQLQHHRVRLTLIDVETLEKDRLKIFQDIIHHYQSIDDEPELNLEEIYQRRSQRHDRDAMFT
jgi:hypothetical protein